MKVLLTGPRGNLGTTLQRLGGAHQWMPIDRGDWPRFSALANGADVIIHAASDLLTPVTQDPLSVVESNVTATARVLEWLGKNRKVRLLFISSCAVYGRSQVTREDGDLAPISINGTTKLLNEQMIERFCTEAGVPFQIFRLFNTYGGGDRFSILAQLQRAFAEKRPFTLLNQGISQRDFVHVEDAARLILRFLERPTSWPILNLGCGEATRIRDIVSEFAHKHPQLEIRAGTRSEAEYSRADISRLREAEPAFRFQNVLDFIRREL